MEMTTRGLWTLVHGMGFGGLYLLACSGALVELWRRCAPSHATAIDECDLTFLRMWLIAMAVLAWFTVLTGTYIIYPWYRAVPPAGTADLSAFPQRLLLSSATTSGWHSVGMEWKEHVAWIVPISITMAAVVFNTYRRNLHAKPELRTAVLCFVAFSFLAAGVAGFFGAMLNKHAPVEGRGTIRLMEGKQ
jgi:O-antigen ligase